MSLGREDLVLDGAPSIDDVDRIVRPLRRIWPESVAAQADREIGEWLPLNGPNWTIVRQWRELFICQDERALRSWIEHGATAENANTMVHLLVCSDSLTVVVDQASAPIGRLMTDVLAAIRRERELPPRSFLRAA